MTRLQKITLALLALYLVWEVVVYFWAKGESGPIIRADLVILWPILGILVLLSAIQYLRNRR